MQPIFPMTGVPSDGLALELTGRKEESAKSENKHINMETKTVFCVCIVWAVILFTYVCISTLSVSIFNFFYYVSVYEM